MTCLDTWEPAREPKPYPVWTCWRPCSHKCHASSNRCLTSSNKKLLETSATLVPFLKRQKNLALPSIEVADGRLLPMSMNGILAKCLQGWWRFFLRWSIWTWKKDERLKTCPQSLQMIAGDNKKASWCLPGIILYNSQDGIQVKADSGCYSCVSVFLAKAPLTDFGFGLQCWRCSLFVLSCCCPLLVKCQMWHVKFDISFIWDDFRS